MDLKLSNVPSEALLQALADLEAAEKDDRYVVDMGVWHAPAELVGFTTDEEKTAGKCYLCMAGAMLRARGGVGPTDDVLIGKLPDDIQEKLKAIDYFRMGWMSQAFYHWFYERWYDDDFNRPPDSLMDLDVSIPRYENGAVEFKQGIRGLASLLKTAGY